MIAIFIVLIFFLIRLHPRPIAALNERLVLLSPPLSNQIIFIIQTIKFRLSVYMFTSLMSRLNSDPILQIVILDFKTSLGLSGLIFYMPNIINTKLPNVLLSKIILVCVPYILNWWEGRRGREERRLKTRSIFVFTILQT